MYMRGVTLVGTTEWCVNPWFCPEVDVSVRVGSNVDSWCGKCKLILAHTVEAMVGSKPKRVQCNTCQAQHVYKANAPGTATTKRKATAKTDAGLPQRVSTKRASDYDKYMTGRDPANARRYSPKIAFSQHDLIQHPKFGLGIATALKDGNKLEILFPDGPRTLIHARA
jgi:hypothetical protein